MRAASSLYLLLKVGHFCSSIATQNGFANLDADHVKYSTGSSIRFYMTTNHPHHPVPFA
jgi:hypothetical protein